MSVQRKGFTLIEALVALIIFGIITAALGVALSTSIRAELTLQNHQQDAEVARAVFHFLQKDLEAAFPAANSAASLFVGNGAPSSVQLPPSLLYLSTLTGRIQTTDPNLDPVLALNANLLPSNTNTLTANSWVPQWDCALVRYWLDTTTGELHRTVVNVPNLQLFAQTNSNVPDVIANHVISMQLQFWDPNQQTWRDSWDFEQPNWQQQMQQLTQQSAQGQSGQSQNATTTTNSATTGDMQLPSAVQITLVIQGSDGNPDTFITTIPIEAQQPLLPNTPMNSSSSSGSQNGSGMNGTNGMSSGGGQ
ncbi:prepilin-type N-terminal cleavage/methylation domain-containing protein [Chthonomonas calidirosea]|uniref:Prepilin-type N-terminal cleavage/methylation domain n=1 Tax=Chthonomonas calidirosea (strain DSM 23976 / ICMP 18418 / T49) TaxID=1303518 RepID=S0ES82_CHTCT|nr:prepilin-type N-terminal cleavage/methylation domain-containing protein [Chthonomonas calidirosea]CCW34031.1 prepilin-type N-terminal cleavage/methylation domain [Chthonomonas calidirosea T49]CEK14830.1 prepilin-type N-terminal cleavage/methylation domain-containing protein [Chthonomonas calidirosea]CEK15954.1 prepilin-type N-terminal cleavage/methylation domain-containing protein [Chthonomonas calidirosea]